MIRCGFALVVSLALAVTRAPIVQADPPPSEPKQPVAGPPGKSGSALPADGVPTDEFQAMARALEKAFGETQPPEAVRMLMAIARGSQMGPGEGWFGPAQSRYSWDWLAKFHSVDRSAGIPRDSFRGPIDLFTRLDRNKNGRIAADDFDWSDRNPYVQQSSMVNRLFRRFDPDGDGRVNRDEFLAFYDRVADGKESFRTEDFRDALLGGAAGFAPGDAPTPEVLVRGLFRGEIGSLNEGPRVDEPAPDFRLTTHDGSRKIRLSDHFGSQPIVLVFGNFTCGPFRSMFPMVDELSQRYHDRAVFLGIYVREAHPSDGWHMESNAQMGVQVAQPTNFTERAAVAQQCYARLKYSMPLLVDEIHDPVGNAYSGMPARLYVIDPDGKVAFKSGRGPFGFRSGEMEQALVMTLLDRSRQDKPMVAAP